MNVGGVQCFKRLNEKESSHNCTSVTYFAQQKDQIDLVLYFFIPRVFTETTLTRQQQLDIFNKYKHCSVQTTKA